MLAYDDVYSIISHHHRSRSRCLETKRSDIFNSTERYPQFPSVSSANCSYIYIYSVWKALRVSSSSCFFCLSVPQRFLPVPEHIPQQSECVDVSTIYTRYIGRRSWWKRADDWIAPLVPPPLPKRETSRILSALLTVCPSILQLKSRGTTTWLLRASFHESLRVEDSIKYLNILYSPGKKTKMARSHLIKKEKKKMNFCFRLSFVCSNTSMSLSWRAKRSKIFSCRMEIERSISHCRVIHIKLSGWRNRILKIPCLLKCL
jgi:hypothetical protein